MNRLVRALFGVVVAKAAVASAWYLYQKSTEQDNDWKTEGQPETQVQKQVESESNSDVEKSEVEVKSEKPARKTTSRVKKETAPIESEVVKPKRVRKPATKVQETPVVKEETVKPKRVRTSVKKNGDTAPVEQVKKTTRSRTKKTQ